MRSQALSFSTRISLSFGGLLLAAMGGLVLLWYFGLPPAGLPGARTQRLAEATRLLELDANQQRAAMAQTIEERRAYVMVIAENKVISTLLQKAGSDVQPDVERVYDRLQRAYPDSYSGLLIVDPNSGRIRGSSVAGEVGQVFADRSLIARIAQPGVTELIEQVNGPGTTGETLAIVRQMPALQADGAPSGKLAGVVIAYLDLARLVDRGDAHGKLGSGLPGKLVLFGSAGRPLANVAAGELNGQSFDPDGRVASGFEGTLLIADRLGRETLAVYRHLPLSGNQGWTLVHYLSKDEALLGLKGQTQAIVFAGLAFAALALLLVALFARRLTRPLRQLTRVAGRLGAGDLSVRAPLANKESREIAELADAFNGMANSVEQGHHELEAKVEARTEELARERDSAQRYLDIARVMLLALDRDGRIAMINRRGAEILGRPEKELLGLDWFANFLPPEEQGPVRRVFASMMNGDVASVDYYENRILAAGGNELVIAWNNAILRDAQGAAVGSLSSGEDISERKRAEERLQQLNVELENRVAGRTSELAAANVSLQSTLDVLQCAQDELIQREKLASLGALVAGVAHELNTPLGNSVTVSTTLIDELENFSAAVDAKALTRNRLRDYIDHARRGMALLARSLERANTLVGNFKRVATDQSSEIRRQFDLAQTVNEVVETISPQFKHTPHRMRVDIPPGIVIDSYPGPLGQVITNLALNSLLHGFSDQMQGEICLSAAVSADDGISLRVSDNGCGIPREHLARIFDPFFTTRLGQGGSGLGLHIVFNIVTVTLGGEIHVDSAPGAGTAFVIDLPRVVPTAGAARPVAEVAAIR